MGYYEYLSLNQVTLKSAWMEEMGIYCASCSGIQYLWLLDIISNTITFSSCCKIQSSNLGLCVNLKSRYFVSRIHHNISLEMSGPSFCHLYTLHLSKSHTHRQLLSWSYVSTPSSSTPSSSTLRNSHSSKLGTFKDFSDPREEDDVDILSTESACRHSKEERLRSSR